MLSEVSNTPAKMPQQQNFKGKYKQTNEGNQYYKTNSAAIAGGVLAVPAFISNLGRGKLAQDQLKISSENFKFLFSQMSDQEKAEFNKILNSDKFITTLEKGLNKMKSQKWIRAALAASLTLGSGLIVNGVRNKNAKKATDEIAEKGAEQAYQDNKNLKISDRGNLYYKSNDGKKLGALLGLGCGTAFIGYNCLSNRSFIKDSISVIKKSLKEVYNSAELKEIMPYFKKLKNMGIGIGIAAISACFALGGYIMGAIADSAANKKARDNA